MPVPISIMVVERLHQGDMAAPTTTQLGTIHSEDRNRAVREDRLVDRLRPPVHQQRERYFLVVIPDREY